MIRRQMLLRCYVALVGCCWAAVAGTALAGITSVQITNNSGAEETGPAATFATESTVTPLPDVPGVLSAFQHRMAFVNTNTAAGGVAQVHKRNVAYLVEFTVEDPLNQGFNVGVESVLAGVSTIAQTNEPGSSTATGASFFVEVDDSTDAAGTLSNIVPLFNGTSGVSVNSITTQTVVERNTKAASLGDFVGTTSFVLSFTTLFSPTTNVFFGNNVTGAGSIVYGLGDLPAGTGVTLGELGHVVTVTARYNPVPEPASLGLAALGVLLTVATRRRLRGVR